MFIDIAFSVVTALGHVFLIRLVLPALKLIKMNDRENETAEKMKLGTSWLIDLLVSLAIVIAWLKCLCYDKSG